MTTYIDVHVIQLVSPSCINRDDTGSPKTAIFGGTVRHRVSSQAWKRATRAQFGQLLNTEDLGERTLLALERISKRAQTLRPELSEEAANSAASKILETAGIKMSKKHPTHTGALVFFSREELERLTELALKMLDGETVSKKDARAALRGNTAIDVSLFGRMLADAPELNIDAACQVAHALSVHKATPEFDFYTAMDDNASEESAGAGMMGTTEFVSSTLYRYAAINVDKLVSNLGSEEAARRAIEAFLKAFATSMPTGKQNSFANRSRPEFLLIEVRHGQPTNLVGAFEEPVDNQGQAVKRAVEAMVNRAQEEDKVYDTNPEASFYCGLPSAVSNDAADALGKRNATALSLNDLAESAAQAAFGNSDSE